jgi:hypothetical protein
MKFAYFMGTSFTKFRPCFHEISIISTLFPPLRERRNAFRVKTFAEASQLFTYAVFQVVVDRKKASSECIPQGGQQDVSK